MSSNLLTATRCKNAICSGVVIRKLHDGDGLYLWVFPDGKKYWRMRYWQGRQREVAFPGVYPKVSLKGAREKRYGIHRQLHGGLDPSAERKAANQKRRLAEANSFQAVAMEWHEKQRHIWVDHHAKDVERRLRGNIFPLLGARPIGEIEAPEHE